MEIHKFELENDFLRTESFLRELYHESGSAKAWLPERLHDIVYRMSAYEDDDESPRSMDYFYLWEENGQIVACLLPDGENVYMCFREGYENMFPELLTFGEKNCLSLFGRQEDGSVKFWVAINERYVKMQEYLTASGYSKFADFEYENVIRPMETVFTVSLPEGYRLCYGEDYADEQKKWSALRLGFHPDYEEWGYRASMTPYHRRKKSSLYKDSFECLVVDEKTQDENEVCSYCFVYVDQKSRTAVIEPVSTREKYQHKGLATAMLQGAINRCKERGIEKCYVNAFGRRKDFYGAVGFFVEECVGFWSKIL